MSDNHGKFVWYELMTTDMAAAEPFYRSVVGWSARREDTPATPYTIFSAGAAGIGGLMPLPKSARDMGVPPHWTGYISVDDVDVYARKVAEAGGAILVPPADIPNVGRFAVAADPDGVDFNLFKPRDGAAPPAVAPGTVGHAGWRELYAGNLDAAFAFYSKLFGWTKGEAFDMGAMGVYQLFATGAEPVGGMMTRPPTMPRPAWTYYFNVAGINDAAGRVKAGGGQVVNGPMQVPGGSWIVQCLDPQGAMFALVSPQA
ncbi:MAG TPA: VOC family protein [Roseiarcus sp.]|nr:VOC family protein [Roseiarcus sp.]